MGMKKQKGAYHHGNLAESLLDAVDTLATQFGLEAVTLRACAKLLGVAPSSAFRHYADKRALLTAFATRALHQLADEMSAAAKESEKNGDDAFIAVGLAYVNFALDKPAFFRAMWRFETIYTQDEHYQQAASALSAHLTGGFASTLKDKDPDKFSSEELLAWSSVHGLASLLIDGPIEQDATKEQKMARAKAMLNTLGPAFES